MRVRDTLIVDMESPLPQRGATVGQAPRLAASVRGHLLKNIWHTKAKNSDGISIVIVIIVWVVRCASRSSTGTITTVPLRIFQGSEDTEITLYEKYVIWLFW